MLRVPGGPGALPSWQPVPPQRPVRRHTSRRSGLVGAALGGASAQLWATRRRAVPQNLYELLQLSPIEAASASPETLKQRQRAILRLCHPDIAGRSDG